MVLLIKKVVDNFCEKILSNGNNKNEYITYNNENIFLKKEGLYLYHYVLVYKKLNHALLI